MIICKNCGSENIIKKGIRCANQLYKCNECNKYFTIKSEGFKFIKVKCDSHDCIRNIKGLCNEKSIQIDYKGECANLLI